MKFRIHLNQLTTALNTIFFLFIGIEYIGAQSESKQFRFVNAKTGLTLRVSPDTEAETIEKIPFGKIVEIVSELPDTINVQGNISNWYEVKYKGSKGFVVSGYLSEAPESLDSKLPKDKDYLGIWKGDWKCGKDFSHIKIKKNRNFSGWLFSGGDDAGCGGNFIKGNWTVNSIGEICLKTIKEESCFFIYNNKLIANLSSANGFKENYEWEFLSGLTKSK